MQVLHSSYYIESRHGENLVYLTQTRGRIDAADIRHLEERQPMFVDLPSSMLRLAAPPRSRRHSTDT